MRQANNCRKPTRLVMLACSLLAASGTSSILLAQSNPPAAAKSSLKIPYEDKRPTTPGQTIPPAELPRKLTAAEIRQLNGFRDVAETLSQQSDENFRRGLLPLDDYLRQLSLSYSLRQNVSRLGVGEVRRLLIDQELARYRGIVQQLEDFNQPAAEGWAADLALANVYLARVEAEAVAVAGESGEVAAALQKQIEWASKHVELRAFDESLGMASPQHVIAATQLERLAGLDALPRFPTTAEYRRVFENHAGQLQTFADQVERWNRQGAGIGRQDRLHHARYELAQAEAVLGIVNQNESARQAALKTAETELAQLMETQWNFQAHGTASLFDLARTWSDLQSIYDQSADIKGFPAAESLARHAADFQRLQQSAQQTQDRRGRISADVQFIAALQSEREFAALQKSLTDPFRADNP